MDYLSAAGLWIPALALTLFVPIAVLRLGWDASGTWLAIAFAVAASSAGTSLTFLVLNDWSWAIATGVLMFPVVFVLWYAGQRLGLRLRQELD